MYLGRFQRSRLVAASAALVLAATLLAVGPGAQASPASRRIDVVSFNVLAPIWAAPDWYPADMDPSFLATDYRRPRIDAFLSAQAATADVVAFQEVQASEFPYLADAIGGQFVGIMSRNDRDFWSNWVVPQIGWAPNGTALFLRSSAFSDVRFHVLHQADGNSVAWASATHVASGERTRIASVHLDSDSQKNRNREFRTLLGLWGPAKGGIDIIAGDFNQDTIKGSLSKLLKRTRLVDVLAALGNREQTHPWLESYYMSDKWGVIDHVLVRGGEPLSGDVIDSGVWSIEDETARIEANFDACGSDHFPVVAAVRPT
jgi:endonuclease/exonuclease/phosphatase family metal-dependent hydrolase